MATLQIQTGTYGELHIEKQQYAHVFGNICLQKHSQMIPKNAVEEFTANSKGREHKKITVALRLLEKYESPITKHGVRALIQTADAEATISDALISKIAKQIGLKQERKNGTVFYSRW